MPETDLQTFTFAETGDQIQTVPRDGEPWIIAPPVARALGYRDAADMIRNLDADEKGTHTVRTPGGEQVVTVISEPGLYRVLAMRRAGSVRDEVMRGRVERFQRWVFHTVIPAAVRPPAPQSPAQLSRMQILEMAIDSERRAVAAEAQVAELAPDAARARQTMDASGLSLVRTVAKRFGIQEKAFRAFLHAEHLLIGSGTSRNEPYAAHVQAGHFEVKVSLVEMDPDRPAVSRSTTYVTPKGEALIWKRLFDAGYVTSRTMPPAPSEQLALVAA